MVKANSGQDSEAMCIILFEIVLFFVESKAQHFSKASLIFKNILGIFGLYLYT